MVLLQNQFDCLSKYWNRDLLWEGGKGCETGGGIPWGLGVEWSTPPARCEGGQYSTTLIPTKEFGP